MGTKKQKVSGKIEEITGETTRKATPLLRKFVMVHTEGQEEIEAIHPFAATVEGKARMLQKGMKYPQDKKDFYEVKI